MGVYLPNMEMPTSPVLFCIHPDGKVFADLEGGWREYKAVPVPPRTCSHYHPGRGGDMKITLEIPNGCKKFHFVLLLSDDETKTFGTTDGQFTPEDGARYKISLVEEGET